MKSYFYICLYHKDSLRNKYQVKSQTALIFVDYDQAAYGFRAFDIIYHLNKIATGYPDENLEKEFVTSKFFGIKCSYNLTINFRRIRSCKQVEFNPV